MKPWEETWELTESNEWGTNDVINGSSTEVFLSAYNALDRLRLAVAAPEMARLLLQAHAEGAAWAYVDGCGRPCFACGDDAPDHAPDCRLVAVLRKAGVLT